MLIKTNAAAVPHPPLRLAPGRREERYVRQAFAGCLEESITEEQVQRVLAPVLAMIRAGAFDRPPRLR